LRVKYYPSAQDFREAPAGELEGVTGKTIWQLITPEARRYAVKELARRAGVARDFFNRWRIEVTPERSTVSFGSGIRRVHFEHARECSGNLRDEAMAVAQAAPFRRTSEVATENLVLPFCHSSKEGVRPLYRYTSDGDLVCEQDLLGSIVLTLSGVEQSLSGKRDEHGRFPASASAAMVGGFLERPILDEHGLAFAEVLSAALPSWQAEGRVLRLKLSHDIEDIGIPFEPHATMGHGLKRGHPGAMLRDLLSMIGVAEPAGLALVRRLAEISRSRGLESAFYWKASRKGVFDTGYDPGHPRVLRVIRELEAEGFEMGVHPGYETFLARAELRKEVDRLRRVLGVNSLGGRQHYLRWSEDTWLDWEACGLSYDSSFGFADHFGFRAGTAYPYRPWCLEENRELNLVEVPLILMDCTPVKYMRMAGESALRRIKRMVERTERTGGVFTLLWHNTSLLDREYDGWYESILNQLSAAKPFHLPSAAEALW
jgi:hypothetical protein